MDGFWGVETELLHAGHDFGLLCYQLRIDMLQKRNEMLNHSSEKLNFIQKRKRNERQSREESKIFRLPFLISQQKVFDQSFFTIQMSLGVFQSKISHGNESRNILL
jgi:hypothetical protein